MVLFIEFINEFKFFFETICNSKINLIIEKKTYISVDPAFSAQCVSHSNGELDSYLKKLILLLKKIDLESPLIFVLFLKGKQNKKEKP